MRLLFFFAFIGAACAKPQQNGRIIGGSIADINKYPFIAHVDLFVVWEYNPTCGSTLITSTAVVTTAYCVGLTAPHYFRVRLGTAALTGGTAIKVAENMLHENYNWRLRDGDIAIMRLAAAAPLSNSIRIARLAGPNYALPDNLQLNVAGWGHFGPSTDRSPQLRHVTVRVINHNVCRMRWDEFRAQPHRGDLPHVLPGNICTGPLGNSAQGSCDWDFGGPVVHQGDVLVAIVGWQYLCGEPDYPTVDMSVPFYINWILERL